MLTTTEVIDALERLFRPAVKTCNMSLRRDSRGIFIDFPPAEFERNGTVYTFHDAVIEIYHNKDFGFEICASISHGHPHAFDTGLICMGDTYRVRLLSCLELGDAFGFIATGISMFNSENVYSYATIPEWAIDPCDECGDPSSEVCESCDSRLCESCATICGHCGYAFCYGCISMCDVCDESFCEKHLKKDCPSCGNKMCDSCIVSCEQCGEPMCKNCIRECERCGCNVCSECLLPCDDCGTLACCLTECACGKEVCCQERCKTCSAERCLACLGTNDECESCRNEESNGS